MKQLRQTRLWAWGSRMPHHYWSWAAAFMVLGFGWGHAIAIYPPSSYNGLVDLSTVFRMGVTTALGGLVATLSLFLSRSRRNNTRITALWLELVGLILLAGGPLQYFSIQVGYLVDGKFADRYALAWFAASMLMFLFVRFTILVPILRKERRAAKDQGK